MNINTVILGGNMCRDVEMRYMPNSGTAVGDFSIAVNRVWKTESGEKKEEVSFFECVAFGKTAENIAQYFGKGSAILLECRAKQEQWEDRETGRKRSKVKFIVEKFHFVEVRAKEGAGSQPAPRRAAPAAKAKEPAGSADGAQPDAEDDVPFNRPPRSKLRKSIAGLVKEAISEIA